MILKAIVMAALALVLVSRPGQAQTFVNITVTADKTKSKGSPWDGPPGISNSRIPLPSGNAAPDLAICIVETGKTVSCEMRREGSRQLSRCQNAFKCVFENISVPDKPFGLIIVDLDVRRHDLVDFAVVLPDSRPSQAEVEAVDIDMHKHVERLTPSLAESDHQRRQKDVQILTLDQCGGSCRLTQSEVRIERAK